MTALPTDPPAVRIRNLAHVFGDRTALAGVSFEVASRELVGLLGPNGSGKSTLFRILATLLRPRSGSAEVCGFDLARDAAEVRRLIGVVFQSPSIDKRLTVRENLHHQGALYGLSGAALRTRVHEMLERVGLADRAADIAGSLSGGQQRRVELAKGLLHRPRVLLLDEPSTGLDPAARRAFSDQLCQLRDRDGVTILLTTHIMEEADVCDRLVILDRGQIVVTGTPVELKRQVAGDCVLVHADSPAALGPQIAERLGVAAQLFDDRLRIETPRGHELIARLVEAFGSQINSITLAKPTLEDVFIDRTGHRLDDTNHVAGAAQASARG